MNPLHWAVLSRVGREILRIAYGFKTRHQTMFMQHQTIAQRVGCSRMTVTRWLKHFLELGWFRLKHRHSRFCEYDVSQVTVTPGVTSDVTSRGDSSILTSEPQRKGPRSSEWIRTKSGEWGRPATTILSEPTNWSDPDRFAPEWESSEELEAFILEHERKQAASA